MWTTTQLDPSNGCVDVSIVYVYNNVEIDDMKILIDFMRSSTSRWPPNVTKCYSPVLHREVLQRGDLFRHQDGTSQIWNFYEEYSIGG